MRLKKAITKLSRFRTPAVPELRYIESAAQRVHDRWPDISVVLNPREREELAVRLRDRVARNDWSETRMSFVLAAAGAVFDEDRRGREDLKQVRAFLYSEIKASQSETFLSGMLSVHLESFAKGAPHTRALANALDSARDRMSGSSQHLLAENPELLDAKDGPQKLAVRMSRMTDPFIELVRTGLRNPHGLGFMERAHEAFAIVVRPELTSKDRVDWFLRWLQPSGRDARTSGAEQAIEALTHPWLNNAPSDQLRSHLVENLIEMYGDPRIRSGGVWAGVDPASMRVIHRWLTREDMRFFTGVVDAAQKDAMWPPRRNFWLKLYDEGMIDAAWVAFSSRAMEYAREHLMRQDARNADSRFGFQRARQNTSLLIMKIGNKIVVDGCHSYRTHVFNESDPMAPPLFQEGYDCDEIMRRAPASKAHNSIPQWERWVRDTINSDVPFSKVNRPYHKILRPRMPQSPSSDWRSDHGVSSARFTNAIGQVSNRPSRSEATKSEAGKTFSRLPTEHAHNPGVSTMREESPSIVEKGRGIAASRSLRQMARARSLTERLMDYGPAGAAAILMFCEASIDGGPRVILSPKARAGLEWLREQRGYPPLPLRNALEHLLASLEQSGRKLDDLIVARGGPVSVGTAPRETLADPSHKAQQKSQPEPAERQTMLPPLPVTPSGRLELLRRHVDELEEVAKNQMIFAQRTDLVAALEKLKDRNRSLRPAEIGDLLQLYEFRRKQKQGARR